MKTEAPQFIKGPAGNIEIVAASPDSEPQHNLTVVVCHPHSQFGGTMNNKVVSTLFKTFYKLGCHIVRFNFRGVGQSEGDFANGIGELDDLLAVLNWSKTEHPNHQFWLAGFSFGSYVAALAAGKWPTEQLILIAPPVHHFDFAALPEFSCPCLVVQGEEDELVPVERVEQWTQLRQNLQLIKMPDTSHFFHGKLIDLRELLTKTLSKNIPD